MGDAYNQLRRYIKTHKGFILSDINRNTDDIKFMIEESMSDGELTATEYMQLNSELDAIIKPPKIK